MYVKGGDQDGGIGGYGTHLPNKRIKNISTYGKVLAEN